MQLISFLSAASALVASVSANAVRLNEECNENSPVARIVNRCDYTVHLWSVHKGNGCPADEMVTLKKGEVYNENLQKPTDGTGISIKISKTKQCKDNDIVQLEYFLDYTNPAFEANYLDVSYVNCGNNKCPTRQDGYYLVAGNQTGKATASAGNTWCPILSCNDAVSCAKMSYILPDDVQTKSCDVQSNLDFYMCGGNAPSEDYGANAPVNAPAPVPSTTLIATPPVASSPAPPSSTEKAVYFPLPSTTLVESSTVVPAAVTPAPKKDKPEVPPKIKTNVEVVYVTAFEYVNAKRHTHGHGRRHQAFHA